MLPVGEQVAEQIDFLGLLFPSFEKGAMLLGFMAHPILRLPPFAFSRRRSLLTPDACQYYQLDTWL